MMKEISINDIENIKIGNAENKNAATGCTVVICENGAPCGISVRGGGPASRETELLNPLAATESIHAVLLSGGSAYGLGAANGVMKYLKERNVGFDTGIVPVPLVCQSCIFDLGVGDKDAYPDIDMAYAACVNAEKKGYRDGAYGAGAGATVGKLRGAEYMMKSGIGSFCIQTGKLKVGAVVCVNALGDVYDEQGKIIAGMLNDEKNGFLDSEKYLIEQTTADNLFAGNTTIGVVITNAELNKAKMNKVAQMSQNGIARAIRPVHTTADGDSMYAMSVGKIKATVDTVGTLASYVTQKAIINAVYRGI